MKDRFILLLVISMIIVPIPRSSAMPQIDGAVTSGEWDNSDTHVIELTTGVEVNLSIVYSTTTVYYLAIIDHSKEVNEINLDPTQPHDYFGIEFDNNDDNAIMGTKASPDDTIMVNYEENIGADMFMHSFKAYYDEDQGGIDNVEGKAGTDGTNLYFEMSRPLITGDSNGFDIDLVKGSSYQIMIAFWDDQPPRSANGAVPVQIDNTQFLTLTVDTIIDTTGSELLGFAVIALSILIAHVFIRNGRSGICYKLTQSN